MCRLLVVICFFGCRLFFDALCLLVFGYVLSVVICYFVVHGLLPFLLWCLSLFGMCLLFLDCCYSVRGA